MRNESFLRKWLRQVLPPGVCCFTQPGLGGTVGQPDALVVTQPSGLFAPIELKVAQMIPTGNIRPLMIRPIQIAWHAMHTSAGGRSFLLLGLPSDKLGAWDCWLLSDCRYEMLARWKRGFPIARLVRVATDGKLDEDAWWSALRGSKTAISLARADAARRD